MLAGDAGDDTVNGQAGDDVMPHTGTADGFDAVTGGAGTDRLEATQNGTVIGLRQLAGTAAVEAVTANGATGVRVLGSDAANTLSFAGVTLTGIGSTTAPAATTPSRAAPSTNVMNGGDGNDTINGGAQDDTIEGNAGDDTINGQDGNDTVQFTGTGDGVETVTGGAGANDRMVATVDGTLIALRSHAAGAGWSRSRPTERPTSASSAPPSRTPSTSAVRRSPGS